MRLQGLLQGCAPRSDLDRLQLLADQTQMQLEASRGELQGELDRTHAELAVCRLREAALEAKIGQAAASVTREVHQRSTELDLVTDPLRHCIAALAEAERERDEAAEEAALLHQALGATRKEIDALKEELMAAHTEKGSLSNAVSSLAAALAFLRLQAGAHAEGSDQPPPERASKSATSNPMEILTGERGLLRLLEWQLLERAAAEGRAAASSGSVSLAASASPQSSGRAPPAASAPPKSPSHAFYPPLEDKGLRAAANDPLLQLLFSQRS